MQFMRAPRSSLRRTVQREAGGWGVMKVVNDAFIQPLLISVGASQVALGIYISGSSLFNFGAGWLGPAIASRLGSIARFTMGALAFSRIMFVLLTGYLLAAGTVRPTVIIILSLLWCIGEGFALPMWTSFLAGMVGPHERGRWVAMRAQAATLSTLPVLVAILLLVLFATREQALPLAYSIAALGGLVSWYALNQLFQMSPIQALPPKRKLTHMPESAEARQFLSGTFLFWFASGLTWPVIPRYLTDNLGAPTAYFAISQIVGACIGIAMQPRWGRLGDKSGAMRILLLSGIGSAVVPLFWALTPVYWLGFLIDAVAFVAWPGHMLGLTLRAIELCQTDDDRPMMLGWTNLAQGGGACISPLLASLALIYVNVHVILVLSFVLRLTGGFVLAGLIRMGRQSIDAEPTIQGHSHGPA